MSRSGIFLLNTFFIVGFVSENCKFSLFLQSIQNTQQILWTFKIPCYLVEVVLVGDPKNSIHKESRILVIKVADFNYQWIGNVKLFQLDIRLILLFIWIFFYLTSFNAKVVFWLSQPVHIWCVRRYRNIYNQLEKPFSFISTKFKNL